VSKSAAHPPRGDQRWTAEEDAYLADTYLDVEHALIAAHLGRSYASVRNRCWRLGLRTKIGKHAPEVEERIRAHYLTHQGQPVDVEGLAAVLGVNRHGVAGIVSRLGIGEAGRSRGEAFRAEQGERTKALIATKGHPRGMVGKTHTPSARGKMAEGQLRRYAAMTPEERSAPMLKALMTKAAKGSLVIPRPQTTWKQDWHTVGGKRHFFRSKWEVNYAHYLEWLKSRGEIVEWEYEPTTFWFEAIKRGVRSYTPDFRVTEAGGRQVYHETKGWMDARSATKLKRMAKYHPDVSVLLVDAASYRRLNRQLLGLVPGWC
jgi:hypothetical protein